MKLHDNDTCNWFLPPHCLQRGRGRVDRVGGTTGRCCGLPQVGIVPVALLDVLRGGALVHAQDDVERLSGRGEGPLPLLLHPGSLAVSLPPVDLQGNKEGEGGGRGHCQSSAHS